MLDSQDMVKQVLWQIKQGMILIIYLILVLNLFIINEGFLSTFGTKENGPMFPANIVADFAGGGTFCVVGILMAIIERDKTGKG